MSARKRFFLLLGSLYRLFCRVPLVGEPAARIIASALGFAGGHVPGGMKWRGSMAALRQDLEKVFARTGIDFERLDHDEEGIELVLPSCPYGFRRPEDAAACDAAMDMDRTMFRYCGCDLSIETRLPYGDPVCRVVIRKKA
ncbi:MAG: hypothetical protein PHP28_03470 [Actinomycetota bacterium]|nr:hypothetical protein [Actinomycetota bacterium]